MWYRENKITLCASSPDPGSDTFPIYGSGKARYVPIVKDRAAYDEALEPHTIQKFNPALYTHEAAPDAKSFYLNNAGDLNQIKNDNHSYVGAQVMNNVHNKANNEKDDRWWLNYEGAKLEQFITASGIIRIKHSEDNNVVFFHISVNPRTAPTPQQMQAIQMLSRLYKVVAYELTDGKKSVTGQGLSNLLSALNNIKRINPKTENAVDPDSKTQIFRPLFNKYLSGIGKKLYKYEGASTRTASAYYDDDDDEDYRPNDEYWLKNNSSQYAGDNGNYNHEMIAEGEILNRLGYDLEDPDSEWTPTDESARNSIANIEEGKSYHNSPYYEAFKEWAEAEHNDPDSSNPWWYYYTYHEYLRWLHEHGLPRWDRMTPELVDRELKGLSNPRKHVMEHYGWSRLDHNIIEIWDLSDKNLENVVDGLIDAYGNRARKQTYKINVLDSDDLLQNVTFDEIESGDIRKRLKDFNEPFLDMPKKTINPYMNNPVGKQMYKYQGASNKNAWYRKGA